MVMSRMKQATQGVSRRDLLGFGAVAAVAPLSAFAQEFPSRPIRIMVGVPPGGSIDHGARVIAPVLGELLRTPVVVENKAGAAGVINTEYVARQPPDGYTLLLGTPSPILIAPQAMPKVKLNPITELTGINTISNTAIAIAVNPRLPVKRLKDLVELSRTRPITMGLPTPGSVSHLVVEMIAKSTGCRFLNVPYKGGGPATTDAIAGHVDATVSDVGVFTQMHQEGRLRIVLVTSEKRFESLPDVPTASEDAPGLVVTNWLGIFAPAGTPAPVIEKINDALMRAVARDEVKAAFRRANATASAMPSTDQFQKFAAAEYTRFGQLLRERNIVLQE